LNELEKTGRVTGGMDARPEGGEKIMGEGRERYICGKAAPNEGPENMRIRKAVSEK